MFKGKGEHMKILEVKNLKKYYDTGEIRVKALDGISFSVEKGDFLAIVGTSGSGKSTLLHMLGGLDVPTSGQVVVDGTDISQMSDDELAVFRRRKTGFVFQNYNLLPLMNVYENIILPVKLDGISPDKNYVEQIIAILGLEKKKYAMPNQLSGGQQQRVALARALAAKPAIILADEPTGRYKLVVQNYKKIIRMFFPLSKRISRMMDRHSSRFSGTLKSLYRFSKSFFKNS